MHLRGRKILPDYDTSNYLLCEISDFFAVLSDSEDINLYQFAAIINVDTMGSPR